jgi:hypothetical protein
MPNETGNSRAKTGNAAESLATKVTIPDEVLEYIIERTLRAFYFRHPELRGRRAKNVAPRTVVEKHFHVESKDWSSTLAALCLENTRAERLILELRQARKEFLKAAGSTFPKG